MKKIDVILFGGQSNMQGQSEALSENTPVAGAYEYRLFGNALLPLQNPVGENIRYDGKKGIMTATMDESTTMKATYIDGLVYVVVQSTGLQMKYKTRDESMTSAFEKIFSTFEKDEEDTDKIASVTFGTRENGVYTLVATYTKEAALETIMKDYEGYEIDASAFTNITDTMVFECTADGYVTKMTETITYTVEGMECSMTTVGTYKNVGVIPEITAPADADSYMDMDAME